MKVEKSDKQKIEEIESKIRVINKKYDEWLNGETPGDYDEFVRQSEKILEPIEELKYQLLLIKPANLTPLDNIGDLFTMEDFINNVNSGGFIDYDGFGHYATKTHQSDQIIKPSHISSGRYLKNPQFTHVMWYNR